MNTVPLLASQSSTTAVDAEDANFARGTQELDPRLIREMAAVGVDADLLAEIVHDLKAPLATIALEVSLLDRQIEVGETVEPRPVLARLMQNVDFLDRLVHDLLDGWSPELAFEPRKQADLRTLLEVVIARSVPSREQSRVRLEAPSSAWVEVDELRIERVVANLVSNALKYSSAQSPILVRLDVDGRECCVSVTDSGPGISERERTFLFEKYARTKTARFRPGLGLGLYTSRRIIESHGGTIGVESTPGVGSRFYFHLALTRTDDARPRSHR